MIKKYRLFIGAAVFCFISTSTPVLAVPHGVLTIFHAGSLTVPMAAIEKAFEAKYPDVDVQREPSGSSKAARKISDLEKPCDIMASADYKVIDKLLRPPYTDNNIRFASNRMVLCYTDQSRYADIISGKNWVEILQKLDVVWGHSAPDLDPCGYRTLMVLQLAEKYYRQAGSVAVQHSLNFVEMPDEINLGNYKFDQDYAQATVEVSGKKPGTTMTMQGKSITYGITLLKDAPNREAAIAFLTFMLDGDGGLKILKEMGQPPFIPVRVASTEMKMALPEQLQSLVTVKQ